MDKGVKSNQGGLWEVYIKLWDALGACMQKRAGARFLSISSVSFPRIKTSKRELIDSPIDSPMDASILLSA